MAKTGSVAVQMKELLDEINENLKESVERNARVCSKDSSNKLKSTSPRRDGSYASGWTSKKMGEADYVVYNKTEGWKTHILENGHVIKNKKGTYGRAPGIKHIAPVEQEFADRFFQDCMRSEL